MTDNSFRFSALHVFSLSKRIGWCLLTCVWKSGGVITTWAQVKKVYYTTYSYSPGRAYEFFDYEIYIRSIDNGFLILDIGSLMKPPLGSGPIQSGKSEMEMGKHALVRPYRECSKGKLMRGERRLPIRVNVNLKLWFCSFKLDSIYIWYFISFVRLIGARWLGFVAVYRPDLPHPQWKERRWCRY